MDVRQMVEQSFEELEMELAHMLEDLTREELLWRPDEDSNSICFLVWHMSRAEDIFVSDYSLRQPQVFERGGWSTRWGIAADETGFGYGREQLAAFPNPPIEELVQYRREVRTESRAYHRSLKPYDYDHIPPSDHPRRRGYTIGRVWTHLICEIAQHVGQISYLRGQQRGLNKRGSVGDWSWVTREA